MYFWPLSMSVNFHTPQPVSNVLSISLTFGLLILLLVILISFSAGVIATIMFRSGLKRATELAQVHLSTIGNTNNPANRSQDEWKGNARPSMQQPFAKSYISNPSPPSGNFTSSSAAEDPLNNKRWLGLAKENVELFNELDSLSPKLDAPRQEMIRHVKNRLREILARSGVEIISRDAVFDIYRHQLEQPDSMVAPGTPITEIVSPGFAISGRVLRPARVRVVGASLEDNKGSRIQ